ncbi:scarecrow-like protein 21 [Abrus precatorius]|uniref:Scarecrow-like protein 21 n=1 Tax=Abrus precatorius TaxID=3816 RepID=A0A8B8JIG0_ABRPR|nr:scarecrow-like protein 21 [Abrus precatorius]XP_027330552.1 scarecrow-like protein 21 [Abrus precatorius]XP_027330553.1 scarecrow-like protein 21 [Abrus precatorius]XP_027330554.1 scarecrow-like protein 21 [Abrus precatorius]XP_027330555.1 scarecrow-like protein 21 [Abrus precatorius]
MSQKHKMSFGSGSFSIEPVQNLGSYCFLQNENTDNYSSSDNSSHATYPSFHNLEQYCTLESSANNSFPYLNSPSTVSFSPNNSPVSKLQSKSYVLSSQHSLEIINDSLENESCLTHNQDDLRHKIRELESAMLGHDSDILDTYDTVIPEESDSFLLEAERWKKMMEVISRGDLKEMLFTCAKAVAGNDMETAEWLMSELRKMVSISGNPTERLGAYMLEALVARLSSSGSTIYKASKCKEPTGKELLSYMHLLYEVCPYLKFGYMSANGAIAEAVKEESEVHIIDFQINQGIQWVSLIQALASRAGGPPKIRITGVDDSNSAYYRGGGLEIVGKRLSRLAHSCNVPFEFHAIGVAPSEVRLEDLELRPSEAIAVNFAMMLHHVPDESVDCQNHRDRLVRLAKCLSPKVVTLVEQESNTNHLPFLPRFVETMNYYLAVFESIDVALPREHKERINVEQHCLATEVVNLVACEGAERVERHELLLKWRSRFTMAGFTPYPLSSFINGSIKNLQQSYQGQYTLEERDGALCLGWMNQALVSSCAWR